MKETTDKANEIYNIFNICHKFVKKHIEDKDFGAIDQEGSITWEYHRIFNKYDSMLYQEMLLSGMEELERIQKDRKGLS